MSWAENSMYYSFTQELFYICYSNVQVMEDTGQFIEMRGHFVQFSSKWRGDILPTFAR